MRAKLREVSTIGAAGAGPWVGHGRSYAKRSRRAAAGRDLLVISYYAFIFINFCHIRALCFYLCETYLFK